MANVHPKNRMEHQELLFQEYIDAGAKTLAVFKQRPLDSALQAKLAPARIATYDIKWDKQALDVYRFD